MDFFLSLAICLIGAVVFGTLAVGILRLAGIRNVIRGNGPLGQDGHQLGFGWRIFIRGVLLWGWPVGIGIYLSDLWDFGKHPAGYSHRPFDLVKLAIGLVIWTLAGFLMGLRRDTPPKKVPDQC